MFGLEKKPKAPFEFDLERMLREDHAKARQTLKDVEAKIHEIKGILREGSGGADFDNLGVLLHGYVALQKVLNKVIGKK